MRKRRRLAEKLKAVALVMAVVSSAFFYVPMNVNATEYVSPYTNLIPLSTESDGVTIYNNGNGYKTDTRLNSSGGETACLGWEVTGYMPIEYGDTISFANMQFATNQSYDYIAFYDSDFTKLFVISGANLETQFDVVLMDKAEIDGSNVHVYLVKLVYSDGSTTTSQTLLEDVAYFRVSASVIDDDSVIALNAGVIADTNISEDATAYQNGYEAGFDDGDSAGYERGYNQGYEAGANDAYQVGVDDGYAQAMEEMNDVIADNYQAGYDTGYDEGYEAGAESVDTDAYYEQGYEAGESAGYSDGYTAGVESVDTDSYYNSGYTAGQTAGYESGYNSGYSTGYSEGESAGYEKGFEAGKTAGYDLGYEAGENVGYENGYDAGYTAGVNSVDTESYYNEGYVDGETAGYTAGYESAMERIENWGADTTDYPVLIGSSENIDLQFTFIAPLYTNEVFSTYENVDRYYPDLEFDPTHTYMLEFTYGNFDYEYTYGYFTSTCSFWLHWGSCSFPITVGSKDNINSKFYISGENIGNSLRFRCDIGDIQNQAPDGEIGDLGVLNYYLNDCHFELYDYGPSGDTQNHIANQTDQLTNGYDSTGGNTVNDNFTTHVNDYNTAEDSLFSTATSSLEGFTFFDFASVPAMVTGLSFVASIMTSWFNQAGGASGVGIVLSILFSVMLVAMALGLYRYYQSKGKKGD